METEEIFTTSLTFADPIGIYVNPGIIIGRTREDFEGRCKNGYYIQEILSVDKASNCMVNAWDPRGAGQVNVIVRVRALRYAIGDIVAGCKVLKNTDVTRIIVGTKGPMALTVVSGPYNAAIKPGQLVVVRIRSIEYITGARGFTAQTELYAHRAELTVYRINPAEINRSHVEAMIAAAKEEFAQVEKSDWRHVLGQAWVGAQSLPDGATGVDNFLDLASALSAHDISGSADVLIARDNRLNITGPVAAIYSSMPAEAIVSPLDSTTAYAELIWGFRNLVKAVHDLGEIYTDARDPAARTTLTIIAKTRLK